MRWALALVMASILVGAAPGWSGKPVQRAVDEYGVPDNVYDRKDGRRVFQWWRSDVLLIEETEVDGLDFYDRSPDWWTSNKRRSASLPMDRSCAEDFIARWSERRGTWIIERRRGRKYECGMGMGRR